MKHLLIIFAFISSLGFSQTSTIYPNFDFELGNLSNWTFILSPRSLSQHSITTLSTCTAAASSTNACSVRVLDTTGWMPSCTASSWIPSIGKYYARINGAAAIACYQFTVNALAPVINVQYLMNLEQGSGENYNTEAFNQILIRNVSTGSVVPGSFEDFCVTTHSTVAVPITPPFVYCLGWPTYSRNLSSYIGQVLRFEFLNTACAYTGHQPYAYFDGYFSSVTGIKEVDLNKNIQIVPNPANDFITIKKSFEEDLNVLIYDAQGKLVKEDNSEKVDISEFQKGLYFIRAIGKNHNYSQTFVKE